MRKNWFNWYTNEVFKKTASFISQYPGTVLINPIIPKTRKSMLISKNLFKQNLKKYKEHLQQKYNFPKSKKYKKVKLEITDISQNGQLRIDFN